MFLKIQQEVVGPPVDWNSCLYCSKDMAVDEERYRITIGDSVGIGHKGCQDEVLRRAVAVKVRAGYSR